MSTVTAEWRPVPGPSFSQGTYFEMAYDRLHLEVMWNSFLLRWEWSYYDPESYDPGTAVSRGHAFFRDNAEQELFESVGDHLGITQEIEDMRCTHCGFLNDPANPAGPDHDPTCPERT